MESPIMNVGRKSKVGKLNVLYGGMLEVDAIKQSYVSRIPIGRRILGEQTQVSER